MTAGLVGIAVGLVLLLDVLHLRSAFVRANNALLTRVTAPATRRGARYVDEPTRARLLGRALRVLGALLLLAGLGLVTADLLGLLPSGPDPTP